MYRDNFVLKYGEEHIEGDAKEIDEEHKSQVIEMKVHGQCFKMQNESSEVNLMASHRWLEKVYWASMDIKYKIFFMRTVQI